MLRLNERTPRPNPHINFITGLPGAKQDDAVDILKAVAAQFKPIMKDHGFRVNSFEEYEWNRVFAGRYSKPSVEASCNGLMRERQELECW